MEKQFDLIPLLDYIDPSSLSYSDWLAVGMALKSEGYDLSVWDDWSRGDIRRYHRGECERKWYGFESDGITGATITQMAKDNGWKSASGPRAIGWDDEIDFSAPVKIATGYHAQDVPEPPKSWDGKADLIRYLETLFKPGDSISITMQSYPDADNKWKPATAYEFSYDALLPKLRATDDFGWVIGDYNEEAGAWICFNPVEGARKNENVTDYRYALVESDTASLDAQYGIIKELQLPCAAVVHSGGKSIHAIVKIDAPNYTEYKTRVEYLYSVLKSNGMDVDTQNKNPARLSRMPGVYRDGKKQYLIATNIGRDSWEHWIDYIGGLTDDYPQIETFDGNVFDNPPDMPPVAIDGLAYRGNLILLSGASKAGKTCSQIELAVAVAEGGKWFGRQCTKGNVLYINFEVDRAPMVRRMVDAYKALNLRPSSNIDLWHLRGTAVTLEQFVPNLLRRIKEKKYDLIIIDPLYKLNDGDENSAGDMSKLFVQLDKIAALACDDGATVVISHHYSKGSQSGKSAMDRASGSGVFARAPDLIIALDELAVTDYIIDKAVEHGLDGEAVRLNGAYRVEFTARYFATPLPENVFFTYPIHVHDDWGILVNAEYADSVPKNKTERKSADELLEERIDAFDDAFKSCSFDGQTALIKDMANMLKVTEATFVRKRLAEYKKHCGEVYAKEGEKVRILP